MPELDLSEIGGGKVDVYYQNCSNVGNEIYMTVDDFEVECKEAPRGHATAIMDPEHARKLAEILLKVADECEKENAELDNHPDAVTARKYMAGDPGTIRALEIFEDA